MAKATGSTLVLNTICYHHLQPSRHLPKSWQILGCARRLWLSPRYLNHWLNKSQKPMFLPIGPSQPNFTGFPHLSFQLDTLRKVLCNPLSNTKTMLPQSAVAPTRSWHSCKCTELGDCTVHSQTSASHASERFTIATPLPKGWT